MGTQERFLSGHEKNTFAGVGYTMVGRTRFELVTPSVSRRCSPPELTTQWCRGPESNRYGIYSRGILSPLRLPVPPPRQKYLEAAPGIEPGVKDLQSSALPLGYAALFFKIKWSGRRDLNSRPSPWQGDALPLSYSRTEQ
jgi:hypothetical protein